MKRRAFLGFMGGAAVAGPTAAKEAASMTLADMRPPVSLNGNSFSNHVGENAAPDSPQSPKEWAKARLKEHLGRSARVVAKERRETQIHELDADVASLRSVALHRKIRMSRDRAFARREREREDNLRGMVAGWWGW